MELLVMAVVSFAGAWVGAHFALRSKRVPMRHDPDLHDVLLKAYGSLATQMWQTSREFVKVVLALAESRPAGDRLLVEELELQRLYLDHLMLIPADAIDPMLAFLDLCRRLRTQGLAGRSAIEAEREMLAITRRVLARMRRTLRLKEWTEATAAFFPKMEGAGLAK